jgi:hypothetical protein
VTDEPAESDLRKRAAWLLAMLALVAGLFVVLFTTLLSSGGGGSHGDQAGPDDSLAPTSASASSHPTPRSSGRASSAATSQAATPSCPTTSACALDGDVGGAVDAINAYRTQHNQKAVPGTVSSAAKKCALHNGSGCSGNYAESQVAKPTGAAAVAKISKLGKLLDPSLTSFAIGWAYDPQAKQYFFAVIRQD